MLHVTRIVFVHFLTDISISGQHTNLIVGSTYTINCTVPGLEDSTILWTSTAAAAVPVSTTNTLTLQSVDSTLNGTVFTCSVNSSKLHTGSPKIKNITVTIQSMSDKFSMSTLNLLIFVKDTSVTTVSIEPLTVTALVGTPPVVFTCTITLNHDIGPDHSALSVDWSSVKSSATPKMGVRNVFLSMTTLTLTQSTQPLYCCNARVVGTKVDMDCSVIEILGEQNY